MNLDSASHWHGTRSSSAPLGGPLTFSLFALDETFICYFIYEALGFRCSGESDRMPTWMAAETYDRFKAKWRDDVVV